MRRSKWEGWTEWVPFKNLNWQDVPNQPGTYMVGADNALTRAIGVDDEGILVVGMSKELRTRLNAFFKCAADPKARGHMAGWLFAHYGLGKHFPVDSLHVSWCATFSREDAAEEEARILYDYTHQHGEPPPLNRSASWGPLTSGEA